jgi:hypothetical protein
VRSARRRTLFLLALLGVALTVLVGPGPAGAQSGGEVIHSYDSALTIEESGDLRVVETIEYDFGATPRHGIERFVQTRFRYDDVKKDFDRLTPITVTSVTADGSPARFESETDGDFTKLRIGDPDRTITGAHTYVIDYRMKGVLNHFDDHDELYFNVIGDRWSAPIEKATASVEVPGAIDKVACFAGPSGSNLPCDQATEAEGTATFADGSLSFGEGMTVVVGFPTGVVPTPEPILEQRWTVQRAFAVRPDTVVPAAGLLVGLGALVGWFGYRVGRDRQFSGAATDVAFGNVDGTDQRVALRGNDPIPVEFVPPDKIRPGQVGTLIDEQANTLDVTATIIDLAVRGYLRINEIPKEGWLGSADWELELLKSSAGLMPYESTLLSALFADGPKVRVSDLKGTFVQSLKQVQDELYDDVVHQGWYRQRPDHTRTKYGCLAGFFVAVAIAIAVALAAFTSYGLVGVALVLATGLLFLAASRMPARTAKGYGTYRRVLGFKQFIDESEKERAQFAERQHLFSEYLPYAVVFGATEKWAKAFAGIDGQLPTNDWYYSPHPFTYLAFSNSINGFAVTTSGTISTAPPSASGGSGFSGGGFSGGGFGGGGGGSW